MRINDLYPPPTWVGTEDGARALADKVDQAQLRGCRPAIDTETTGLGMMSDVVLFWSICYEHGSRHCLPAKFLPIFQPLFDDRRRQWWFTNAKFDKHMLANTGISFEGDLYCTMPADWLVDDTKRYALKESVWRHFDERILTFSQVFGIKGKKKDVGETLRQFMYGGDPVKKSKAVDYASSDAWHTFRLGNYVEERLRETGHWHFVPDIYVPMTRLLWDMEREGINVDVEKMKALREPLSKCVIELEDKFANHAGRCCNMKSPHDLRRLFFEELGRQPKKLTKGGESGNRKPALDKSVLKMWSEEGDPMAEILIEHRKTSKLISTYIDGLSEWLDPENKIHCTFNTHRTRTGRLSTSDPTLQNIPIRGELGPRFRECFCATGDNVLLAADYSQLEQAVMAHFCQDPHMLAMVREGKDIHAGSAVILDGVEYEDIVAARAIKDKSKLTEEQKDLVKKRDEKKHIGFALNYGMGKRLLAHKLGVDVNTAENLRKKYLARFPKMNEFIKSQHRFVRENYKVFTILGRPRRLWSILAGGKFRAFAERAAVNTRIQGCQHILDTIRTANGIVLLRDLDPAKHRLLTYNSSTRNFRVHETGRKSVYRVETTNGTAVVTRDHRFLRYNPDLKDLEICRLSDLNVGESVVGATPYQGAYEYETTLREADIAELIGILCGDGYYGILRSFRISMSGTERKGYATYVTHLVQKIWPGTPCFVKQSKGSRGNTINLDMYRKGPRTELADCYGLAPAVRDKKRIPSWIKRADPYCRARTLKGLYDTDGGVSTSCGRPTFTNISEGLAHDFYDLCCSLGIRADIKEHNAVFRVFVRTGDAKAFIEITKPYFKHKQIVKTADGLGYLPEQLVHEVGQFILDSDAWAETREKSIICDYGHGLCTTHLHVKANFSRKSEQAHVYRLRSHGGSPGACKEFLNRLEESEARDNLIDLVSLEWARIRKIESAGKKPTRDIEILDEKDHCYISNGLVMHNSAADIVMKAMIRIYNDKRLKDLDVKMLLQIHDELVFKIPKESAVEAQPIIKELMEYDDPELGLTIPLRVDGGVGKNWNEAK